VPLPAPNGANGSVARVLMAADAAGGEPPAPAPRGAPLLRAGGDPRPTDRQLLAKRDRLIERFTAMQLDLGGVYYEMAIRDHLNTEVLTRKAAEMQRVDAELRQVEQVLAGGGSGADKCPSCDALYAPGAAFCSQCGTRVGAASAPDARR
jgi:hypothetical protein